MALSEILFDQLKIKPSTDEQKKKAVKGCFGCLGAILGFMILLGVILTEDEPSNDAAESNGRAYIAQKYGDRVSVMEGAKWFPLKPEYGWPDHAHIVFTASMNGPAYRQSPLLVYIRLGVDEKSNITRDVDGLSWRSPY